MPAPHPKEFRDDVVAVARKGETPLGGCQMVCVDPGVANLKEKNCEHDQAGEEECPGA